MDLVEKRAKTGNLTSHNTESNRREESKITTFHKKIRADPNTRQYPQAICYKTGSDGMHDLLVQTEMFLFERKKPFEKECFQPKTAASLFSRKQGYHMMRALERTKKTQE